MSRTVSVWSTIGSIALVVGCSGSNSSSNGPSNAGAANGGGAAPSSGGALGNGGATQASGAGNTGGANAAGGSSQVGGVGNTGGANAAGGGSSFGGTSTAGSTSSTGGSSANVGGTKAVGGTSNTGGSSANVGGTKAAGGTSNTGGGSANVGGTKAAGGTTSTGGSQVAGGSSSTGGNKAAGGTSSTGGSTSGCSDSCPFANGITWKCKKRFMYGVNYAWSSSDYFGLDFGGKRTWSRQGVSGNATAIDRQLSDLASNGVSVVRWWIWPDFRSDGVTFSGNNATGLSGTMTQDINKALELAAKHDMYIMLTLFSFDTFKGATGNGPNLKDIATNATARSALITNAIRPVARAAATSPNKDRLISWDVINEPEWAITGNSADGPAFEPHPDVSPITESQMITFVNEVIVGLRAESDALMTVGSAAAAWHSTWAKTDLDFYQYHLYDWNGEVAVRYAYSDPPSAFGATDKPVIMGEFPLTGLNAGNYSTLLDSWYGNGYAGALGWAVTDPNFCWSGTEKPDSSHPACTHATKTDVKAFADKHPCETQY